MDNELGYFQFIERDPTKHAGFAKSGPRPRLFHRVTRSVLSVMSLKELKKCERAMAGSQPSQVVMDKKQFVLLHRNISDLIMP
jgi:hypothetical protein